MKLKHCWPALFVATTIAATQPAVAQEDEGLRFDLERLREYTGEEIPDPQQLDRRVVLESKGSYYVLDTHEDGVFTWAIFKDLGDGKGVEFSLGAEPQAEKQSAPVQALAIPIARSACGGPGEPILVEPPYVYPLFLAYCRIAGSSNPRLGKSVVSTLPGNNDPARVVATWQLSCADSTDAYELWIRGIWYQVCVQ